MKQKATMIQNAMKNLWMIGVFLSYSLWSQIPAGMDAQHATAILLNTDSVYSQSRSQGWFSFTTSSVSSVSGNVINLKSVLIPRSTRIIAYDTVMVRIVNVYDSQLNLLGSDTLRGGDTSMVFTVSVSANQTYYIQTIANYPCDTCEYNEAVSFGMKVGVPPTIQCSPYCDSPIPDCSLVMFFYNPNLGYPENCLNSTSPCSLSSCEIMPTSTCGRLSCFFDIIANGFINPSCSTQVVDASGGFVSCPLFTSAFNPSINPLPFSASSGCNIPVPTITLCPSVNLYLGIDWCGEGLPSTTCTFTTSCAGSSNTFIPIGGISILQNNTTITSYQFTYQPVPINTSTIMPLLPTGTNSFTIQFFYNNTSSCTNPIAMPCSRVFNVIIVPLTANIALPTNTICVGQNFCFNYSNPSSIFNYSTFISGPGGYTFAGTSTSVCTGTLTTPGVYTITSLVSFNYSNATDTLYNGTVITKDMYCNDTLKIIKTFTVTDCCINTKPNNVVFDNVSFVNGPPTSFIPNTIYTGAITLPNNYTFSGNFTFRGNTNININCTFSKSDLLFSDGASLNISSGKQVNFNQSYLHSCGIWKGISLQDNASISVKHSVIEDAFAAIQSTGLIFPPLIMHPNISVENTVFNKNIYGIFLVSSITSGFNIKSSIFTSRNINPLLYNIVLSSSSPNPPLFNTILSPAFLNPKPPGLTNSTSFAYPAFTSKRTQAGIYIIKSGNATSLSGYNPIIIGVARNSNTSPLLENSTTNLFDYLNNGILLWVNSEAYTINNYFQNIFNTTASANTGISNGAIYSSSSKLQCGGNLFSSTMNVTRFRNYFTNCLYGTKIDNGANVFAKISNNTFNSCTNGIYIEKWQSNQTNLFITNNTSNNTKTFLYSFNNTLINASVSSNTVTGGNKQIFIDEVLPNNNIHYLIDNNSLTGAYQPIIVNNAQNVYVQNNQILIQKAPPFLTPPISIQAGVEFNGSHAGIIANNSIKGNPPGSSVDMSVCGIRYVSSNNGQIYCNDIQQVGIGINPDGIISTALIHSNNICDATMPRAYYGIFSFNTTFVGNVEGPGSTATYHTANNNKFGITVLGQFNNAAVWNIAGPANVYYFPSTSSPDYPLISSLPRFLADAPNNTVCFPPNINSPSFIVSGLRDYIGNPSVFTNPGRKINDRNVYRIIKESGISNVPGGNAYLSALSSTNIKSFYGIDSSLVEFTMNKSNAALTTAKAINQTLMPTDSVDIIQQQTNDILIKMMEHDSLTNNDVHQLKNIAQLCPYRYGTAVFQARSMIRKYDSTNYVSACESLNPSSQNRLGHFENNSDNYTETEREVLIQVYPNPTKDHAITVVTGINTVFELYDIAGKVIFRQELDKNKFNKIHLENISEGIYLYKIKKDNVVLRADKLIIQ